MNFKEYNVLEIDNFKRSIYTFVVFAGIYT